MAEQEVIKHTKQVFKIWNSKQHTFWHKLKEFAIEIAIIVFAVTLSIWLHDKSEDSHHHKIAKEFLLGLKNDLANDIVEMNQDKQNYLESKSAFDYILHTGTSLNADSLKVHQRGIFISVQLIPNDGRYEGFKSSGNMGFIENSELQNDVLDFYQEDLKTLISTTAYYSLRKEKFFDYYLNNFKKTSDTTTNVVELLTSDMGKNYCRTLAGLDEIIARYNSSIAKATKIIHEINKEYKLEKE